MSIALDDLAEAIREFEEKLPGWWYTVGKCTVSGDASIGPDRQGRDAHLLEDRIFDEGFHCDLAGGEPADALREVTRVALERLAR